MGLPVLSSVYPRQKPVLDSPAVLFQSVQASRHTDTRILFYPHSTLHQCALLPKSMEKTNSCSVPDCWIINHHQSKLEAASPSRADWDADGLGNYSRFQLTGSEGATSDCDLNQAFALESCSLQEWKPRCSSPGWSSLSVHSPEWDTLLQSTDGHFHLTRRLPQVCLWLPSLLAGTVSHSLTQSRTACPS